MDQFIKKTSKYSYILVYSLFSIMLGIIIINSVFFVSKVRGDYTFPINSFLLLGLVFVTYLVMILFVKPLIENYRKYFNVFIVIVGIIVQIIIVVNLQGAAGIDDFDIRLQVAKFLNGNYSLDHYFIYAANNIPITFLFTLVGKIATFLGLANHLTLVLNIFQCLLMDTVIGILILIFNKEHKSKISSYILLIYVFFIPFSIYGSNIYTDVPSMCFAMYGAESFYFFKNKHNYLFIFLAGIFEGIAYLIKMNLIIMTISILILTLFLFKFNIRTILKTFVVFLAGFLFISFSCKTIENKVDNFSTAQVNEARFPYTYWISMGLNSNYLGESGSGSWAEGNSLGTYNKRSKFYEKRIKQQLSPKNFKQIVKLYAKKINIMYSQGEFASIEKSFGISKSLGGIYQHISGNKTTLYIIYSQIIYIIILINSLVYSLKKLRNGAKGSFEYLDIFCVFFVGIFLFHILMWEVMPRYAIVAFFSLIPITSIGTSELLEVDNRKNAVKYTITGFLTFTIIGISNNVLNNKPIINEVSHNSKVIVSQIFPEHDFLTLNVDGKGEIKEWVNIPYKFKKLNVTYWAGGQTLDDQPKLKLYIYSEAGKKIRNDNSQKQSGKYLIVIRNISNKKVPIAIGKTPKIDLLQPSIIGHKDCYLNFNVTE